MKLSVIHISFLLICVLSGCAQDSEVKNVCSDFIKGRMELRKGDSELLREVSSDSLYMLMMLHHDYMKIVGAPVVRADLNIWPTSVQMNGDCGTCKMSSEERYYIHVCLQDDRWVVVGENDHYPSEQEIIEAREKIVEQEKFLKDKPAIDSVLQDLYKFSLHVKDYFQNPEESSLEPHCNSATSQFLEEFYNYSIERSGKEVIENELSQPKFVVYDVTFNGDTASCQAYNDDPTIQLLRTEGGFEVIGFNQQASEEIGQREMDRNYGLLLKTLKIIRQKSIDDGIIE